MTQEETYVQYVLDMYKRIAESALVLKLDFTDAYVVPRYIGFGGTKGTKNAIIADRLRTTGDYHVLTNLDYSRKNIANLDTSLKYHMMGTYLLNKVAPITLLSLEQLRYLTLI